MVGEFGVRTDGERKNTKINAENKAKVSMAGTKRVSVATVAASKPGLRPRTALGDIGNKAPVPVPEPQTELDLEPESEAEPVKEEELPPEPILVDTPSPSPMETSGCAPAEEYLCQAFSDVILAVNGVDAEDRADPNLCSEYVKDIYAYLRQLEEEQAFMQDSCVPKKMLQLVGVTAMFIASKYEEMYPQEIVTWGPRCPSRQSGEGSPHPSCLPFPGWSFNMGSAYEFHSWRVFIIVCALPCVSSVVALTFMPESPRFLLEVGKHDEAWMILKLIHDTNMRARGQPEKVFTVNRIKTPRQIDELIEIESDTGTWYRRCFVRIRTELYGVSNKPVLTCWPTWYLRYYGLSIWFPDVIKHLQSNVLKDVDDPTGKFSNLTTNFTTANKIVTGLEWDNGRFEGIRLRSITFKDSVFKSCTFEDVTSVNTYFKNCMFINTVFNNTDFEPYKFINCEFQNCTFLHNKTGCRITFEDDYGAYWIYFVNFLGTLAVLPGNIVSALLMDRIGRLTMLGGSMVLSGISCFFLWFGTSESMMIGMLCLYNGLTISAWNSLDVVTVELYPTDRRYVEMGLQQEVL
ncbi:hypothetical protein J1605_010652 [Eschrichtius robustus]|uniref:Synaptic vesicle glycoprotein 2C n=1 Tax=Eschrichtius robustus TaxID=9764 RepID=A0AB34GQV1_ESCRO|nr:hypothetical protein J1605_010652 [Eschrichtius robustus]